MAVSYGALFLFCYLKTKATIRRSSSGTCNSSRYIHYGSVVGRENRATNRCNIVEGLLCTHGCNYMALFILQASIAFCYCCSWDISLSFFISCPKSVLPSVSPARCAPLLWWEPLATFQLFVLPSRSIGSVHSPPDTPLF